MLTKDYNTRRSTLILKEYGRNVQNLIAYIKGIEGVEERTQYARTLISMMRQLNPSLKDTPEINQKLWDDLYIMADFDIELNGPYPAPDRSVLTKKPKRVAYKDTEIRFKHYGRNIELLVKQAIMLEDEEEKEVAISYVGRLMKTFHYVWSHETVEDNTIIENLRRLSNGRIVLDPEMVKEKGLFEVSLKDKVVQPLSNSGSVSTNGKNGNGGKKKGQQRRRKN